MRHALIDLGPHSLDVMIAEGADLDDTFEATCNDTGEYLRINGWLIDNIEFVDAPRFEEAH